jgi:tetratricopeptide (TPR) repeat protein
LSSSDTIVGLGARSDFVAPVPNADAQKLGLSSDETALLAAVGRAAQIDEVVKRSGMTEPKAIALLLSLRAKGVIAPARVSRSTASPAPVDAAMLEEVDLDEARKREVLELEQSIDGKNHYQVLGVEPGSAPQVIKGAFYELSRRFHPDRFYGKSLGSFRARIERIFRRISEAHVVLADDERRATYLKAHPELTRRAAPRPAPPPPATPPVEAPAPPRSRTPEDDARSAERRSRLAKHPYLTRTSRLSELIARSKAHVAQGEFGMAYADLNLAAQVDPKNAEVQALLAEARKRHDAARAEAEMKRGAEAEAEHDLAAATAAYRSAANIDALNANAAFKAAQGMHRLGQEAKEIRPLAQRAVDLDPASADHHALLGSVLLDLGVKKLAQKHLEAALALDKDNAEAKKSLKKGHWPF